MIFTNKRFVWFCSILYSILLLSCSTTEVKEFPLKVRAIYGLHKYHSSLVVVELSESTQSRTEASGYGGSDECIENKKVRYFLLDTKSESKPIDITNWRYKGMRLNSVRIVANLIDSTYVVGDGGLFFHISSQGNNILGAYTHNLNFSGNTSDYFKMNEYRWDLENYFYDNNYGKYNTFYLEDGIWARAIWINFRTGESNKVSLDGCGNIELPNAAYWDIYSNKNSTHNALFYDGKSTLKKCTYEDNQLISISDYDLSNESECVDQLKLVSMLNDTLRLYCGGCKKGVLSDGALQLIDEECSFAYTETMSISKMNDSTYLVNNNFVNTSLQIPINKEYWDEYADFEVEPWEDQFYCEW